jgi:hypothetical protein
LRLVKLQKRCALHIHGRNDSCLDKQISTRRIKP